MEERFGVWQWRRRQRLSGAKPRNRLSEVLLLVVERFAVRAYLDLGFLPVGIDLGVVGDELAFLGERLDFQDFSFASFGLQASLHVRGQGVHRNLLFYFNDGTVGGHGNIFGVAIDGHFRFIESLAVFFFGGEPFNGGSFALGRNCLFDSRRKIGAFDFLFLG